MLIEIDKIIWKFIMAETSSLSSVENNSVNAKSAIEDNGNKKKAQRLCS